MNEMESIKRRIASAVVRYGSLLLLTTAIMCGGTSKKRSSNGDDGDAGDGPSAGTGQRGGATSSGGSAPVSEGGAGAGEQTGGRAGEQTGGNAGEQTGGSPPDLPQPSTPGMTRCGGAMCDSQSQICCSGMAGSGVGGSDGGGSDGGAPGVGGSGTSAGFESCSSTFCPFRRECDETADCVGTEVCCFSVFASPPAILGSTCQQPANCAFDGYWLGCGSQDDCEAADAPPCVAQLCGGQTIQTCGPITRSACL